MHSSLPFKKKGKCTYNTKLSLMGDARKSESSHSKYTEWGPPLSYLQGWNFIFYLWIFYLVVLKCIQVQMHCAFETCLFSLVTIIVLLPSSYKWLLRSGKDNYHEIIPVKSLSNISNTEFVFRDSFLRLFKCFFHLPCW